jgi:RNA recognition motif-containing protein
MMFMTPSTMFIDTNGQPDFPITAPTQPPPSPVVAPQPIPSSIPSSMSDVPQSQPIAPQLTHHNNINSGNATALPPSTSSSTGASAPPLTTDSPRLFVGNLRDYINESTLRDYFSQFGDVRDVYFPKKKDQPGPHAGYGFVTFSSMSSLAAFVVILICLA